MARSKRVARLLTLAVFVAALLVYRATLHPGVFPGESSRWTAVAMGIESHGQPNHLFWQLLAGFAARLPLGAPIFRLNMLPALCGALGVALLFAVVRSLLLIVAFTSTPLGARQRKRAAALAGAVAALALGASAPFWLAATRCLPQTFEVLLLLIMGWLLIMTATTCRETPLAAFGFLLGVSVLEWKGGLPAAPVMLFLAWRAMRMGLMADARGHVALISGVALGILAYLLLAWLGAQEGWVRQSGGFLAPLRDLIPAKVPATEAAPGGRHGDLRLASTVCFALLPWLAACALSIWRSDRSLTSASGLLDLVLCGATAISLAGLTISPWGVCRAHEDVLPCTAYLMVAMVAGYLAGDGALAAGGALWPQRRRRRRKTRPVADEETAGRHADAAAGRFLATAMLLLTLVAALLSHDEVRCWREPLAGRVAAEVTARLHPCGWLATDGSIDRLVRIHARLAGRRVKIVNEHEESVSEAMQEHARRVIGQDPAFEGLAHATLQQALATNTLAFLETWLRLDPAVERKLLVYNNPALWERADLAAVPAVVAYRGARERREIALDALLADHDRFWTEVERLPALGPRAPWWLKGLRAGLRAHLHDVGARLAGCFAENGRSTEATAILERMRELKEEPRPPAANDGPYHY